MSRLLAASARGCCCRRCCRHVSVCRGQLAPADIGVRWLWHDRDVQARPAGTRACGGCAARCGGAVVAAAVPAVGGRLYFACCVVCTGAGIAATGLQKQVKSPGRAPLAAPRGAFRRRGVMGKQCFYVRGCVAKPLQRFRHVSRVGPCDHFARISAAAPPRSHVTPMAHHARPRTCTRGACPAALLSWPRAAGSASQLRPLRSAGVGPCFWVSPPHASLSRAVCPPARL